MNIGSKISKKRKELGMTQQELANKLFVSVKTISKWETNHGNPEINMLPEIAKVLGVDIKDLFETGEDDEANGLNNSEVNNNQDQYQYQYKSKSLELSNQKIIDIVVNLGIALFGIIFYFLTFFQGKRTIEAPDLGGFPWVSSLPSQEIWVNIVGYGILFKITPNNLIGFILILSVWVSFLSILSHILLGALNFVEMEDKYIQYKKKAGFIIAIVELVAIVLVILLLISGNMGIGPIMILLLFIFALGYEIYKKKRIENNE